MASTFSPKNPKSTHAKFTLGYHGEMFGIISLEVVSRNKSMGAAKDVGNGESATPTSIFKAIPAFFHSTTSSVGALVPGGGLCYKNHMQNGVPLHVLPLCL